MNVLAERLSPLGPFLHQILKSVQLPSSLRNSRAVRKISDNLGVSLGILVLLSYGIWLQRPTRIALVIRSDSHLPIGLFNPKNFCYLNALLQALSSCPLLLISLKRILKIRPEKLTSRLICILESLRCSTRYLEQNNLLSVVQTAHLEFIRDLTETLEFDPINQQDVHELFTSLSQKIFMKDVPGESELISNRGLLTISDFAKGFQTVNNCASKMHQSNEKFYDFPTDRLPLRQLENSQPILANRIVCDKCSYSTSPVFQPESGIFLYLDDLNEMSIEEALSKQFRSREHLKDILCPQCTSGQGDSKGWIVRPKGSQALSTCYKEVRISSLPNFLVFFVQRIAYTNGQRRLLMRSTTNGNTVHHPVSNSSKKNQHVKFSHSLDMIPYTLGQSEDSLSTFLAKSQSKKPFVKRDSSQPLPEAQQMASHQVKRKMYNLRSLIVHRGSDCNSGHYIAMRSWKGTQRKRAHGGRLSHTQHHRVTSKETWLSASDESIIEVSSDQVLTSQAYLLFYERDLYSSPSNDLSSLRTGTMTVSSATALTRDDCASEMNNSEYDFDRDEYLASLYAEFDNDSPEEPLISYNMHLNIDQMNRADFIKSLAQQT